MAYQMFPFLPNKDVSAKIVFLQVCQNYRYSEDGLCLTPAGWSPSLKKRNVRQSSPPLLRHRCHLSVAPQNCRIIFAHPIARNQCRLQTCFEKAATRRLICHQLIIRVGRAGVGLKSSILSPLYCTYLLYLAFPLVALYVSICLSILSTC